jgi:ectoine hydroxylase-related dioxygenase (phytanoyl-CoA dioxygenase family)
LVTHRPHLRDARLDEVLERDGFVLIPGAARSSVRPLRRLHHRVVGQVPAGFDSTFYSGDRTVKEAVHTKLLAAMTPMLDSLFVGHEPLLTNFVTKGRSESGVMPPHQDWTFVDEDDAASLNVWIPLVAVDRRNGAMSLLPHGHQMPLTIRGTDTPDPFGAIGDALADQMVEVPMRAGDVLVHDHRVLHGSPPNRRRRARVVAGCALLPEGVRPLHFRQVGPGRLERFELDPTFFTEHTFGAPELPSSATKVADVAFEQPVFARDDLPGRVS